MIKLIAFFLFLYLFLAYVLRWFVLSNSPEYFKQFGDRTLFTGFFDRFVTTVYQFFLEYCSYGIALTLVAADYIYHYIIIYFKPGKISTPVSEEKPPILLIHGYMMRGWTLMYLKKRLQKDGWNNVYSWNYIPPFKEIPYYAGQLENKISDILKETSQSKIILICHSMGGLLARYYISHLKGKSYVEKLITIGTPHKGTQLWSFTHSPCGTDMRPGSNFLKKLGLIPATIKTLSIFSSFDEIVLPYQNSCLKGKNILNKEFDNLGHMRLVFSAQVYEEVQSFLSKSDYTLDTSILQK